MNGINYSALLGNTTTGFFQNKANEVKDDKVFNGRVSNSKKDKSSSRGLSNADSDTLELGQNREVKAGYDRPRRISRNTTDQTENADRFKKLDENGIQEGIELSDEAKSLLSELRKKYGNMDIAVAVWSTDEEQDYYASKATKEYSVLINPEALEEMARDEEVRAKYESVLSGAGEQFDTLKEELGEDIDKVKGFSITIDKDGNVKYAIGLLKDMEADSAKRAKTEKERLEKKRAERKEEQEKAEKELMEKRIESSKEASKQVSEGVSGDYEKIEASSLEELIKAVKERLYPESVSVGVAEDNE